MKKEKKKEINGFNTASHGYSKAEVNKYLVETDAAFAAREKEYIRQLEEKDRRIAELEARLAELGESVGDGEVSPENKA